MLHFFRFKENGSFLNLSEKQIGKNRLWPSILYIIICTSRPSHISDTRPTEQSVTHIVESSTTISLGQLYLSGKKVKENRKDQVYDERYTFG